ncbi:hypothetical protein EYB53_018720 [Candidatus Chloroploca sp. M-50]|uniref:Uncharacterized protein n=1 Tax=Candidatus Chloroploca mongolica TaxID=2528176 RepID=A0ABS4DE92_9CHLR|nr:hypothetical protein [Candidatus Chloroploca mongolica]MBP1467756.1 hypothetical protein [Candidatus Chloroploca mongolica]
MTGAPPMGTVEQHDLANEIYQLLIAQGTLFALHAPIRQTLTNLTEFLALRHQYDHETLAVAIETALEADPRFTREEVAGEVRFVTSRHGAYMPRQDIDTHSFRQRLHEPEHPLPVDDISVVVSTSRPAITSVEPVYISDYWQVQVGIAPVEDGGDEDEAETGQFVAPIHESVASIDLVSSPVVPFDEGLPTANVVTLAETEPAITAQATGQQEAVETEVLRPDMPQTVVEPVEGETITHAPVTPVAPVAPVAPVPSVQMPPAGRQTIDRSTIFTLPDGTMIDLRQPSAALLAEHGSAMAQLLADKIEQDPLRRIVSFGRYYFPEANVVNLGKNDLRKIREYMLERNEPLLDAELINDVFYHNARQADYEGLRFSINYRLHREKDFEFVGVEGANLWSTRGLPVIGGKRIKAAEMGQITSYLVEGFDDSRDSIDEGTATEVTSVTHQLTFFEWEYGIIPLDAALAALLPGPVLSDQRSAVLRFDSPQRYSQVLVEVRYPTGNRGGWLQGLEEFFHEHLVPSARVTLTRTDEPGIFTLTYEEGSESDERILTFDEKKNKLGFNNVTFYCAIDEELLPSQSRLGRLNRLKAFPMGERRKAEMILEHVAEVIGEQVGSRAEPQYAITLDDFFVAYNVLRPASKRLLRSLLEHSPGFVADETRPDLFTYVPMTGTDVEANEDEDDEQREPEVSRADVPPTRRRYGGRYDEDDE